MEVDQSNTEQMQYVVKIPFPSEKYAEIAMKTIGVDAPFKDTKTKKTSITREMELVVLEDGVTYLEVQFKCDKTEINSMRTCASSFFTNVMLVCQTMADFGN